MIDPCAGMAVAVLAMGGAILAHRHVTRGLLRVRVLNGAVVKVWGRAPEGVINDLRDVVERSDATGTIRLLDGGRDTGAVELDGRFDPAVSQRVRNVLGNVPLKKLRR